MKLLKSAVCATLLLLIPVAGMTLELLDRKAIEDMIDESDLIIIGKIVDVGEPGDGSVWAKVKIVRMLKGNVGENEVIVVAGGGRHMNSTDAVMDKGQPKFHMKEKTILFLREAGDHFEVDRAETGKRPDSGLEGSTLPGTITTYLRRKVLR